jgi:hypothetical protein
VWLFIDSRLEDRERLLVKTSGVIEKSKVNDRMDLKCAKWSHVTKPKTNKDPRSMDPKSKKILSPSNDE